MRKIPPAFVALVLLALIPRVSHARKCTELVAMLFEEAPSATETRAERMGWFARRFFGEARVKHWLARVRSGEIDFTARNPSREAFPRDYVYRVIGEELIALGPKAVPFIRDYVELGVESGLKPEEAAYYLNKIGQTCEPARQEVFARALKEALAPKSTFEKREAAAHMIARLGPDIVRAEDIAELAEMAKAKEPPEAHANIARLLEMFCVSYARDAIQRGVPFAPEDLWQRFFFGGDPLQPLPEASRAKTVSALESLLDDTEAGPHAAAALVLLSSAKGKYDPPPDVREKIMKQLIASYGILSGGERYFTDLAIALLARQGEIAPPPWFLADLVLSRAPEAVRAGALRPLARAVTRYAKDHERSAEKPTAEHHALVAKIREILDSPAIQATRHPVLKDLKRFVEAQGRG